MGEKATERDDIDEAKSVGHRGSTSNYGLLPRELSTEPPTCQVVSCRNILYAMIFLGFVVAYSLRVCFHSAIVAMVNHTAVREDFQMTNVSGDEDACPRDPDTPSDDGEFNWNRHQQGLALAAFYYGYIFTQIPSGWAADQIGGRWLFGGGTLLTAALTLLTPAAARLHLVAVVALRTLEGLLEGIMLPATHALMSRWTPEAEITRAVTVAFSGQECGLVVGMLLGGVLSDHGFAGGWPSVFYVFGTVGCVWSILWFLLCHSSPSTHPRISVGEREHLEKTVGKVVRYAERPKTPWRKIFTSAPLMACCLAKFAHNWGYHTVLKGLPLFFYDVLGFSMTANGVFAALPFLAAGLVMIATGHASDWLRAPGQLSTTGVRKLFMSCGLVIPSLFFILSGFLGCDQAQIVTTMVVAVGSCACAQACATVNPLDLSKEDAATLLGITNTCGTVASILTPHVFGALTYDRSNLTQWRKVFCITAGVEWVGTIVYVLCASGDPQNWRDD